jgi:hypothetical protein
LNKTQNKQFLSSKPWQQKQPSSRNIQIIKSNREVENKSDYPMKSIFTSNQAINANSSKDLNLAEPQMEKFKKVTIMKRPTNDIESVMMAIDAIQNKYCRGPSLPTSDDNLKSIDDMSSGMEKRRDQVLIKTDDKSEKVNKLKKDYVTPTRRPDSFVIGGIVAE